MYSYVAGFSLCLNVFSVIYVSFLRQRHLKPFDQFFFFSSFLFFQLEVLRSRLPPAKDNPDKDNDIHRDIAVIRSLEKAVSKLEKEKKKVEEDFYMYQVGFVKVPFII